MESEKILLPASEKIPSSKFERPDDIKILLKRLHPDYFGQDTGPDSAAYWAGQITRLLNNLRDSEQTKFWPPAIRDEMTKGKLPRIRLVRRSEEGQDPVLSSEINLPRYAHSFLLGLDAFTSGEGIERVMECFAVDSEHKHQEAARYFETRFKEIASIEEAKGLVMEFANTTMPERTRDKITGRFSLLLAKLYERQAEKCSDLKELADLKADAITFLNSGEAKNISLSEITITLDSIAVEKAKQMLLETTHSRMLSAKWTDIATFPFSAPDQDMQLLAGCFDEVGEKLFVRDIKRKKTIAALDALRLEIENFKFQSLPEQVRDEKMNKIKGILDNFLRVYGGRLKDRRSIDK
ncbi:MAG: hypothetical protein RLZZ342_704 [Candidatus Parcubacteria bacterium]|jgi:hypothetical protein